MPYQSEAVANKFVEISRIKPVGDSLTLMKLLKLVYFAHGWNLALTDGIPLISEQVEAWKFGPVAPSVYHAFKSNGSEEIKELCTICDTSSGTFNFVQPRISNSDCDPFFEKIWSIYGPLTAYQLSQLTHEADGPWYKVWNDMGGKDRKGMDIPDELIKEYFKQKMAA